MTVEAVQMNKQATRQRKFFRGKNNHVTIEKNKLQNLTDVMYYLVDIVGVIYSCAF